MPPEIERLTRRFLRDPVRIEVARKNSVVETIEQRLVRVSSKPEDKRAALRQMIRAEDTLTNAIIFCNRKRDVATLARSLERHGFNAAALHGDMDQKSRTETLDRFRQNKLTLLVASDVAARGLDIPAVSHVFNFDVPTHPEDYIHRIGRTGRAGRSGVSITLAAPADGKYLDAIVRLIQRDIPEVKPTGVQAETATGDEAPHERRRDREAPRADGPRRERGGRSRRPKDEPTKAAAPAPATAPVNGSGSSAPRRERELAAEAIRAPNPPKRRPGGDSPFGSDGPVPAFLLRPGRSS
jgi:superfamily II DNA/RNA helicase